MTADLTAPPLVVEVTGQLGHAGGRRLAELLHGLPVDGRSVEVHLPDADGLPANALAACVYLASRLRGTGGRLLVVAGTGVAATVARARLTWLVPVAASRQVPAKGDPQRPAGHCPDEHPEVRGRQRPGRRPRAT